MALALEMAADWLSGRYIPSQFSQAVGDAPVDIFGQTITVGSKVKLIGTVTAINMNDPHFQDIVVNPDYPNVQGQITEMAGNAPLQKPTQTFGFHPLMLVKVGSSL